jgi:hypothetical protein
MAYARFRSEGSDLYIYEDVHGYLVCMRCDLSESKETRTSSRKEMIEHMRAHVNAGHKVPQSAFVELEKDMAEFGDKV